MQAAKDGNIYALKYLIEEKQIDVNTQGRHYHPWVS